jgi:uncharacterized protein (TIGR02118 family)
LSPDATSTSGAIGQGPEVITRLWLGTRRSGLSRAAFSEHWYRVHGPYGLALPGLRAYVQNHLLEEVAGVPAPVFDGCSELDFDDVAAMQAAFTSPEMEEADRDERAFADPDRFGIVVAERRTLFGAQEPDTDARLLCFVRADPRCSRAELIEAVEGVAADQAERAGAVRGELLIALAEAPEAQACDLVVSLWFPTREAMVGAARSWDTASAEALTGLAFGREIAPVRPRRLR